MFRTHMALDDELGRGKKSAECIITCAPALLLRYTEICLKGNMRHVCLFVRNMMQWEIHALI